MIETGKLLDTLPAEITEAELDIEPAPEIWSYEQYLEVIPEKKRKQALADVVRPKRWAGLARYSTLKQDEDSLSRQWKNVSPLWQRPGNVLVAWVREPGKTGTTNYGRPGLAQIMALVRAREIDALGVEDVDRLYRNVGLLQMMYEEMVECGVELWDSKNGKLNWIQVYTLGLMAQLGRDRMLSLMADGRKEKILKGRIFSRLIFAYRYHETRRKSRRVNEELRGIVVWIFEQIAAGATCYQVALDLNAKYPDRLPGAPTRSNGKPPFDEKFVRRLIENELYMGLSRFNRKKQKRDYATRRVVGQRDNPLSKQLFVEVKHLRIVSVRLWSLANARLVERNPGVGNGGKRAGPFSGRILCGCGAPMKRHGPSDRKYLRCERQLNDNEACRLHGGLPLAWVEGQLLNRLAEELCVDESRSGIASQVSAMVVSAKNAVTSVRREKSARLAAVTKDLDRLFNEGEMAGYSETWLATSRQALCIEQDALQADLARRDDVAEYDIIVDELKELKDAIATIARDLPFQVKSAEDQALLDLIHQKVAEVRILASDDPGSVHFVMRLNVAETAPPLEVETDQLALPLEDATSETEHVIAFDAVRDFEGAQDRRAPRARTLAEVREATAMSGIHDVPTKVWKVLRPLLDGVDFGSGEMAVAPRRVLDAVFFALRTGTDLAKLPSCYGAENAVFRILHRMARRGTLDPLLEALETHFPDIAAGLELSKLRNTRFPRNASIGVGAGPDNIKLGPRHAAELEAEANKLGVDPAERARMLAVAATIDGQTQQKVADRFYYSRVYISLLVRTYRGRGVDGLRSKGWNQPKSVLTDDVYRDLEEFIAQGFDPDRPYRPLTLARVREHLLAKDIDVSVEHLGRCLNERGISLREAIAAARAG